MSNYTITTDFGAKDSLPSSNDSKVVRGSEFTTEFTNIQTAIATKADTAGDTFTGVVNFSADVAVNTNTLFVDVSEAKVGIGTSSPSSALDLGSGDLRFTGGAGQDIVWGSASIDYAAIRRTDPASQDVGLAFHTTTNAGVDGPPERMRITHAGNVGIGTTNPSKKLHVKDGDVRIESTFPRLYLTDTNQNSDYSIINSDGSFSIYDDTNAVYRMTIDSSGTLLVGTTDTSVYNSASGGNTGFVYSPNHLLQVARETTTSTQSVMNLNKMGVDGNIIEFYKDGTNVGSIGTVAGDIRIGGSDNNHAGIRFAASTKAVIPVKNTDGDLSDNTTDLGASNSRFEDLYLSGGVYLGGTGSANKLDDYEEGTWTPAITGSTSGSASYTPSQANYTKIGNQVYIQCYLTTVRLDTHNIVGEVQISGLPFSSAKFGRVQVGHTNLTTANENTNQIAGYTSGSAISLREGSTTSAVTDSDLNTSSTSLMVSGVYTTNA